jgi:hypothetical protein
MQHGRADFQRIQDPEHKIPEDEPVFLLRAQDPCAGAAVRFWANLHRSLGGDPAQSEGALQQAYRMDAWPIKKQFADLPEGMQSPMLPGMPQPIMPPRPASPAPEPEEEGPATKEQVRHYLRLCNNQQLETFRDLLECGVESSRYCEYQFFNAVQPLFTELRGTELHPATRKFVLDVVRERLARGERRPEPIRG